MHKFSFLFILLLFPFQLLSAQDNKGKITGSVFSVSESVTIFGADVKIKFQDADTFFSITSTDEDGNFTFEDVDYNTYDVTVEYFGYPTQTKSVTVDKEEVVLERFDMVEDLNLYKDVVINADIIANQQKGDTNVFNADAFKVNPDASAEDLIRKMPGVDLSEGTPKVQGENVTKVLVDGKPFFGDDVNSTLKNIPAEMIQNVEIYDERSEQSQFSGIDDGQTTKTINLVTRENKKQGMFGKFYGGYGLNSDDNYYTLGGSFNHFKGNQRITLLGMSNNINIQNFTSEDMSGGMSRGGQGGGMNRGGGPQGRGGNMMMNSNNGITTTNAAGINYSNQWSDKVKLTSSYFFTNSDNSILENVTRNYDAEFNNGQVYKEINSTRTQENSHRFDMRLEYQIDSNNYISFSPNLRYQETNRTSNMNSNTVDPLGLMLAQTSNLSESDYNTINGSYRFLYNHSFNKKGRTISISNNSGFNKTNGYNQLDAYNQFIDTTENEELKQYTDNLRSGYNTSVNINYTEPMDSFWKFQVNAGIRYQHSESDKTTNDFNEITNEYDLINTRLSNKFESDYTTQFAGLAFAYNKNKMQFNAGANYQLAHIMSEALMPNAYIYDNEFLNLLPYAMFGYNFTKTKSLRFRYSTSTNTPSINQLQNVIDNTNPMILRAGNPNLNQNYDHRFFVNYRANNTVNNSSFFIMMMLNLTNNYVSNSTYLAEEAVMIDDIMLQPGMQLIRPVNVDGYYRFFSHGVYSFRLKPIKSNINVNYGYSLSNTPNIVNDVKTNSINSRYSLGLNIGSNISEKIDFNVGTQFAYNTLENSFNNTTDNSFFTQTTRLDVNYYILKNLFFNTQLNHSNYSGLTEEYNQNYTLWNMAVGYKFMKKQEAELKLSVFDLLKQNRAITPMYNEFYSQITTANVLQQYFMLTFTYNLRQFKGNTTEADMNRDRPNFDPNNPHQPPYPPQGAPQGPPMR